MRELDDGYVVAELDISGVAGDALGERLAQELAETFQALADPTRVRLISMLVDGELCVGDLAAALDMTVSAISHQLALLHRLRILRRRREGRYVYYGLDDEHIATIYHCGLEHLQHS